MATPIRVSAVMQALFGACDGVLEFRSFDASGPSGRLFASVEDTNRVRAFWRTNQGLTKANVGYLKIDGFNRLDLCPTTILASTVHRLTD